jgi:hypothetical protein
MSLDYKPNLSKPHVQSFQVLFHAQVIPNLLTLMEDTVNCRTQAHGAAALLNFCEHATADVLAPYLEAMLTRLGAM